MFFHTREFGIAAAFDTNAAVVLIRDDKFCRTVEQRPLRADFDRGFAFAYLYITGPIASAIKIFERRVFIRAV